MYNISNIGTDMFSADNIYLEDDFGNKTILINREKINLEYLIENYE